MIHPRDDHTLISRREIGRRIGLNANAVAQIGKRGGIPGKVIVTTSGTYHERGPVEQWIRDGARTKTGIYRIAPEVRR